jgi:Acetyltransferase (GNAT) domain
LKDSTNSVSISILQPQFTNFDSLLDRLPSLVPNFFLGKTWTSSYFSHWPAKDAYGVMCLNKLPIAYLSIGVFKSRLGFEYKSIGFNRSSSIELNDVTLEANGLLGLEAKSLTAIFPYFIKSLLSRDDWDEIRFEAISKGECKDISKKAENHKLIPLVTSESTSYITDLDLIRQKFSGDFLLSRSANTRAQLRRAKKNVERELGKIELKTATSQSEALLWLGELASFHKLRWNGNDEKKGFGIEAFSSFQKSLLKASFETSELQMLQLSAGGKPLGYLYNFVFEKRVFFYMSGVDYQGTEHLKPGMLMHWLAIEHNLRLGVKTYDFLAGTNRYKESLCTDKIELVSLTLRRPKLAFRVESVLRKTKGIIASTVQSQKIHKG